MKPEAEVQQLVQMEAAKFNCILMRNNSGAFKDDNGRWVFFGLGNTSKKRSTKIKSSDLIGITTITITPDMVGKQIGVFTAFEVKDESWKHVSNEREHAQNNFIQWTKSRGGFASFIKSVDELRRFFGC